MLISQKITTLRQMKEDDKCIIDWDLHHKINGTRKIDKKYKYLRPDNNKKPGCFNRIRLFFKKMTTTFKKFKEWKKI